MRRTTSALRLEEAAPGPVAAALPLPPALSRPATQTALHAAVASLSRDDLAALEDELDFYAFTGMAGPRVKALLDIV